MLGRTKTVALTGVAVGFVFPSLTIVEVMVLVAAEVVEVVEIILALPPFRQ